jgi:hypothetical protein
MLANPVVLPAYANPLVWTIALLALLAEVAVARALLARRGCRHASITHVLVFLNLGTWMAFLVAMELADRWRWLEGTARAVTTIGLLELGVVLVEGHLLREMARGRLFSRDFGGAALGLGQALWVSLCANLVSIAISVAVPATFALVVSTLRNS